jgi:hypothetical protein
VRYLRCGSAWWSLNATTLLGAARKTLVAVTVLVGARVDAGIDRRRSRLAARGWRGSGVMERLDPDGLPLDSSRRDCVRDVRRDRHGSSSCSLGTARHPAQLVAGEVKTILLGSIRATRYGGVPSSAGHWKQTPYPSGSVE